MRRYNGVLLLLLWGWITLFGGWEGPLAAEAKSKPRRAQKASTKKKARKRRSRRGYRGYPFHRRSRRRSSIRTVKKLQGRLKKLIRSRRLRRAKVAVVVTTTKGKVLFAHNPSMSLIPASNIKLLTTAAALHYLGPHYKFVTKLYGDSSIDRNGVLKGNLYIKGGGDPALRSEELWRISRDLKMMGLRKITGRVCFDSRLFDKRLFGPGWEDHSKKKREKYRPYLAGISALSLNYNSLGIGVRPGLEVGKPARIMIDPKSRYIRDIVNRVVTTRNGRFRVRIRMLSWRGYREKIELKGTVPLYAGARMYWRRVSHPDYYTAYQLAEFLRSEGIQVSPWVRRRRVPSEAVALYKHHSPALGVILRYAGKQSSNFSTEQIIKMLGYKRYGKPGTWAKGVRAVQAYLKSIGISRSEYTLINGSGLSRQHRFSPTVFAKLLRVQLRYFATRPDFIVAQPVAAFDGTLRNRMKRTHAAGVARAKTGTIDGVSSLSGYVETRNRQILIFSIIMNGRKRQGRSFRRVQNRIVRLLTRFVASE